MKLWDTLVSFKQTFGKIFRPVCGIYDNQLDGKRDKLPVNYNIYGVKGNLQDYVTHQNRIHRDWKQRFFYPVYWLSKHIFGKYLVKEIGPEKHYRNLRVFDKAFEKTCYDWASFVNRFKEKGEGRTEAEVQECLKNDPIPILRTLKQFVLTIAKNDTAYLEFFNILMFNITKGINDNHPKEVEHLIYTSSMISDPRYFYVQEEDKTKYSVSELDIQAMMAITNKFIQNIRKGRYYKKEIPPAATKGTACKVVFEHEVKLNETELGL